MEGVSVYIDGNYNGLLDAAEVSTTTDADGWYRLQIGQGTYTVRADISEGRVATLPISSDSYSVTVEIGRELSSVDFGEAMLLAPGDIDLLDSADSGTASDDDLTNRNNQNSTTALHFQVDGIMAGAEVLIFSDGVQIGSAVSVSSTVIVNTDGFTVVSDGTYSITPQQVIAGVTSDASAPLLLTVDTTPPAEIASTAPAIAQAGQWIVDPCS